MLTIIISSETTQYGSWDLTPGLSDEEPWILRSVLFLWSYLAFYFTFKKEDLMECYSSIKVKAVMHVKMWVNLEDIMLSERRQAQKSVLYEVIDMNH